MSDDRTLDDIRSDHCEALKHIVGDFKTYRFKALADARIFRSARLDGALSKLGVNFNTALRMSPNQEAAEDIIDQMLVDNKVLISNMAEADKENVFDQDRGIYIYKDQELVYFISLIYHNVKRDLFEITTNSVI